MKKIILITLGLLAGLLFGVAQAMPAFQAAGTAAANATTVSPAWPAHSVGDVALLIIETRIPDAVSLSIPAGFVLVTGTPQTRGPSNKGTKNTVYWARATSTAMAAPTVTAANHVYAQILTYRGVIDTGNPWDVTGGGGNSSSSTAVTVSSITTTVADTLVVQLVSRDASGTGAFFSAQTNANLTSITERSDAGTAIGAGGGFGVWDGGKASIGAIGVTTATLTPQSIHAWFSLALKPPAPPTVAKSFSPATILVNGTSTLSITITNPNAVSALSGVAFTDTYPSSNLVNAATPGVTNTCGGTVTAAAGGNSLALSGGTISGGGSCTVTVVVASAVPATYNNTTGPVTTTFTTAGTEANASLTVQSIILSVTKTTSTPTIVNTSTGTTATYTVTVTNTGTAAATGVVLTDTLPAGFTFASNTAPVFGGGATRTAISDPAVGSTTPAWGTFSLPASGGSVAITFVANVASTVADGLYNNSASVTATNATSIINFNGAVSATDNITVTSAVLAVTKTTSTPTIVNTATGTSATYILTVTNSGTANATGAKVIDTLAAGFTYASTTSVTLNGTALAAAGFTVTGTTTPQWDSNPAGGFTINSGQNLVITFVANVANTITDGTYNNSASATGVARSITSFDGTPIATTVDNVTVTSAVLAVTKTTSTPTVTNTATGTSVTYTLTVTNSGTGPATAVKVTDTLAAGFTYASTSSVMLNGTAVAATSFTVTGTSMPQWDTNPTSGFTINAGQTLVITFVANVASSVVAGTYNNSANATGVVRSITNFDGAASTNDDVTVTVNVLGVSLNGFVYNDANHNIQKDGSEAGTGLTLFAKLVPAAGGPALQVVAVNLITGAYQFSTVTANQYNIVIDDNATLADITPTIPAGWIGTEMPNFTRANVLVSTTELQNINFGLFNGSQLSGVVFSDNGTIGGTANNGIKDGGEQGIAGVTVKASTGATIYDTAITDGAGSYTLWIAATATNPVLITETNLSNYLSTGGSVGNTAGTYARTTDSTSLTITTGTIYTNVNFGDVPVNRFAANGLQSGLPGNVLFYAHQFDAGSAGTIVFSSSSAPAWPAISYRDLNCNGVIDAIDTVLTSAAVVAGGQVCMINKVTIPVGTALGLQANTTIQAVFTYTNASPALSNTLSVIDTTSVGAVSAGLVLTKSVDKATAQPNDTVTYTLTYQNNSNVAIASIVINDATPAYTTFLSATCVLPLPTAITACTALPIPAVGGVGSIKWSLTGTLSPASTGQVSYSVKVNN